LWRGYTPTGATTCDVLRGFNDYYLAVLDTNGDELCNNGALANSAPNVPSMPFSAVIKAAGVPFTVWDKEHDYQWRIVAVPRNIVDSTDYVTVVVAVDLVSSDKLINQFLVIFLGFGLAVIVLGAALTRLLVTSTFAPLRRVEATAAAIATRSAHSASPYAAFSTLQPAITSPVVVLTAAPTRNLEYGA